MTVFYTIGIVNKNTFDLYSNDFRHFDLAVELGFAIEIRTKEFM